MRCAPERTEAEDRWLISGARGGGGGRGGGGKRGKRGSPSARQSRIALFLVRSPRSSCRPRIKDLALREAGSMSSDDPRQVRHTVINVHYQCPPAFSLAAAGASRRSLPLFLTQRDDLPRRSYENSNAFVRRPSDVRPISSSSRRLLPSPTLFSLSWPQTPRFPSACTP